MSKFFKEPLVQFLVGGLLLYAVITTVGPADTEDNPYIIPVNDNALLLYLQYQDKAFDTAGARKTLAALDAVARKRLEANYIRDEVLVREAKALGLNNNDEVIRRRLIQKMDFIVQGFAPVDQTIEASELEAHFAANIDLYKIEAEATFTHIFFSNEKRGTAEAVQAAQDLLPRLNSKATPFEKAGSYGDRFYFLRNYVKRPKRLISDHFGIEMTDQLFSHTPSNEWLGPFTSQYGTHLLLVRAIKPARAPDLAEVADRVLADLKRERLDAARVTAISKLAEKYTLQHSKAGK